MLEEAKGSSMFIYSPLKRVLGWRWGCEIRIQALTFPAWDFHDIWVCCSSYGRECGVRSQISKRICYDSIRQFLTSARIALQTSKQERKSKHLWNVISDFCASSSEIFRPFINSIKTSASASLSRNDSPRIEPISIAFLLRLYLFAIDSRRGS